MPQKLYLDEDVPSLLRDHLLQRDPLGFHIEHAGQVARGRSDAEQLRYAVTIQATLVTHNIRDFQWLHRWWKTLHAWSLLLDPHPGILAAPNSMRIDPLSAALCDFLIRKPAPRLANLMYIYRPSQQLWVREPW